MLFEKKRRQNFVEQGINVKIVHFCYFQNIFPFVSMSRQTDDIGKTRPKRFVEQDIPPRPPTLERGVCRKMEGAGSLGFLLYPPLITY